MRYSVTLATRAFELITYDVVGKSEDDAKARAASKLLKARRWLDPFDIAVAKVVDVGPTPRRARRRRRAPAKPAAPVLPPASDAAPAQEGPIILSGRTIESNSASVT